MYTAHNIYVGDTIIRNAKFIEENPGYPNPERKVKGFKVGGYVLTDDGDRQIETMATIERGGFRVDDLVCNGLIVCGIVTGFSTKNRTARVDVMNEKGERLNCMPDAIQKIDKREAGGRLACKAQHCVQLGMLPGFTSFAAKLHEGYLRNVGVVRVDLDGLNIEKIRYLMKDYDWSAHRIQPVPEQNPIGKLYGEMIHAIAEHNAEAEKNGFPVYDLVMVER